MLVLTRKSTEAIRIGDNIEISVIAIDGDQVKLGISAPKSVEIHRKEIYDAIQLENNEAANLPVDIMNLLEKKND